MSMPSAVETKPSCQPASSDRESAEPLVLDDDDGGRGPCSGHGRGAGRCRGAHSRFRRRTRRAAGAIPGSHPPLLSADEERVLAERTKAGDTAAQHQLILANMRLVLTIVHDYKDCGLALDDLVQEGNLGLIRASQDFDPTVYGNRFRTYAAFWIRTSIHRALAAHGSLIRSSEYAGALRLRYRRAIRELEERGEGPLDLLSGDEAAQARLEKVAELMGISLQKLKIARPPRVYPNPRNRSGEWVEPVDIDELAADHPTPESELIDQENEDRVHAALFRLSPFEAWVIRERYGFRELPSDWYGWAAPRLRDRDRDRGPTGTAPRPPGQAYYHRGYVEIGRDCGLSVHRLRLVEKAALDKLRKLLGPQSVGSSR